jgi:TPR repeat protein
MSGQIFISYRRGDASFPAGRLYDRLSERFPHNQIFLDVDLDLGVDFAKAIEESVASCDVLLAVIGKQWLSSADEKGRRRLDNPEDFVRLEIGTALKRGIRVIPVLVEGALMPQSDQLPEDLKLLVRRNALNVSHERFRADSERLINSVVRALEGVQGEEQERVESDQHKRETKERPETERRESEARGRFDAERRTPKQNEPEGIDADSRAPPSNRTPSKKSPPSPKRPRRLPVVIGSGLAILLLSIVALLRLCPSPPGAEWFAKAKLELDARNYAQALRPLQKAAEAGNSDAMNNLGLLYQNGEGVAQDYAQARQWFQKAADAGNAWGMYNVGEMYEKGQGVVQDDARACEWYQKAAEAGNVTAMRRLGELYTSGGPGFAKNYHLAREWYQKAADKGDEKAKNALKGLPPS